MSHKHDPGVTEALYEALAQAIDAARGSAENAQELESQFLAKLAFLALCELPDDAHRRHLMDLAGRDLG